MNNLDLYEKVRSVPAQAQKTITGGRLNGKTDINPMWRIKELTNQFGPCGIGWKYTIEKQWLEQGANGEIAAFVNILLFFKNNDEWSDGVPGTGGSMFIAKEKNGQYTSDECYKMALTDAISVSCKALGFGADIYWQADKTKYDRPNLDTSLTDRPSFITEPQQKRLFAISKGKEEIAKAILAVHGYKDSKSILKKDYDAICKEIEQSKVSQS